MRLLLIKKIFFTAAILVATIHFINAQSISYGEGYDFRDPNDISYELITTGLLSQYTFPAPEGVVFDNTGTKLFVLFNGYISQYNVATPFDLSSTATFVDDIILTEEGAMVDMVFSSDGNTLFIVGTDGNPDHIEQYALGAPFDITSGVTHAGSLNVGNINPVTVTFNDLGTKMYLMAGGTTLHQYSLTTPYHVITGVTSDGSVSLTEVAFAGGLNFNHDGSLMFVMDQSGNRDLEIYHLSTSFNVLSTLTHEATYDIHANNTAPTGIDFSSDGKKFYVIGSNFDDVSQYAINANGGFMETAANTGEVEGSLLINLNGDTFVNAGGALESKTHFAISNAPAGLSIIASVSPDGTTATITFSGSTNSSEDSDDVSGLIFTFVDGAFTGGDASSIANSSAADSGFGVDFDDNSPPTLEESFIDQTEFMGFDYRIFDLANKFADTDGHTLQLSVNSSSTSVATVSVSNEKLTVTGVSDGTSTITVTADDGQGGQISDDFILTINAAIPSISYGQGFDLSNPTNVTHEVTTAGLLSSVTLPSPEGLLFNDDGTRLFVLFNTSILQFGIQSPYDMNSTATEEGIIILTDETSMNDMTFNNDGTKLYVTGTSSDDIHQYALSAPYDITSGVEHEGQYALGSINPYSITFSTDGFKMFVNKASGGPDLNQYSLSVAFDVTSSITSDGSLSLSDVAFTGGVNFNHDGSLMFVLDQSTKDVEVYGLTTLFDITSGVTNLANYSISGHHNSPKGIEFNYDGSKFYVIGSGIDDISQYSVVKAVEGFVESAANEGAVEGSIIISSIFDAFTNSEGSLQSGVDYHINNLPTGLTPDLEISVSGRSAVLTLSGNANNHQDASDLADLQFTFENSAFVVHNAVDVANTQAASSSYGIDFLMNTATDIITFVFAEQTGNATINDTNHTVAIEVGSGTNLTSLTPSITVSDGGNYTPPGAQNFTSGVTYTVTAENLATQDWIITVTEGEIAWNGSVWSNGTGPTSTDDAIIIGTFNTAADGNIDALNLTVNSGSTIVVGDGNYIEVNGNLTHEGTSLTVQSGGSLVTHGSVTGTNFTFERTTTFDVNTGKYSIVGAPISGANFSVLGNSAIVYGYDESQAYNVGVNDGIDRFRTPAALGHGSLQTGVGYFSANTGDTNGKITFAGTPNFGSQNVSLSLTDHPTIEDAFEGFNLVANPYPCAIDYTTFISGNSSDIEGAIYLWDDFDSENNRGTNADYVVVNDMGNVDSRQSGLSKWDGNIRSMQGFFVQAKSDGDLQLDFTDAMKVTANNSDAGYYRKAYEQVSFKLILESNEGDYSETLIGLRDDASEGKDQFDARLFSPANHKIYSHLLGEPFAIQGLPVLDKMEIPIGIQTDNTQANFEISLSEIENINGMQIFLMDHLLDRTIELTTEESYQFTNENQTDNRFSVMINNAITDIKSLTESDIIIFQNQSKNLILRTFNEEKIIASELIGLTGQRIELSLTQLNTNEWKANLAIKPGLYIVKLATKNSEIIQKVIIK